MTAALREGHRIAHPPVPRLNPGIARMKTFTFVIPRTIIQYGICTILDPAPAQALISRTESLIIPGGGWPGKQTREAMNADSDPEELRRLRALDEKTPHER